MPAPVDKDQKTITTSADMFGETVVIEGVEIFKTGTWNGDTYTDADISSLVENFNALADKVKPPLKLGHNETQDFLKKDGLPAAGWITKLKKVGNTIVATLSDVPKRIAELIKNKAYKRVSAEIYPQYRTGGASFKNVLRAVALLGGDIPAVESLKDIEALYLAEDTGDTTKWYSFSLKDLNKEGGEKQMADEVKFNEKDYTELLAKFQELEKKYAGLEEKVKEFESEDKDSLIKKLQEENGSLKDELEKKKKAKEKEDKKLSEISKKLSDIQAETKTKEINSFIEDMKKQGKVLPKDEQVIRSLMENTDNTKVIKFTEKDAEGKEVSKEFSQADLVKSFVAGLPALMKFTEISSDGKITEPKGTITMTDKNGKTFIVVDTDLADAAKKYAEDNKISYAEALIEVGKGTKK